MSRLRKILNVIGAVGIVMWLVAVVWAILIGMGPGPRKGPVFRTLGVLHKTALLLDDWQHEFGAYPPGDVSGLAAVAGRGHGVQSAGNLTNAGSEALYAALLWPGYPDDPDWAEDEIGNTDEDRLSRPVTKDGDPELFEVRDAWGHPLVYFRADDYDRYAESGAPYLNGMHDEVLARPIRLEDGSFLRPRSFQVFSMGTDGEPNTEDDIVFGAD